MENDLGQVQKGGELNFKKISQTFGKY